MITTTILLLGTVVWLILTIIVFGLTGFDRILACLQMWFDRKYWTGYNLVEATSYAAKAIVIVPGLIWGIQFWWFYILTLITSLSLIWSSNRKLLPTLVVFNTVWVWVSVMAIAKYFFS